MSYIRGEDREQASLLPARIDDYVGTEAAVRVIDAFAEGLNVVGSLRPTPSGARPDALWCASRS
jgi:transposase